MNLEHELTDKFRNEAHGVLVAPPSPRTIHDLVARRRRRRVAARGGAGVALLACGIGGLAVIANRGSGQPADQGDQSSVSTTATNTAPISSPDSTPLSATSTPPTAPPDSIPLPVTNTVVLEVTNASAAADQWSILPSNDLGARFQQLSVATDSGIFVWGGYLDDSLTDGAYYDAQTRTWRTLPPAPLATDRGDALGVWTGTEVVVINGISGNVKSAAFNPATFTWRALPDPAVDNAANGTSQAAYVDGSVVLFSVLEDGAAPQNQVARLDIASGTWGVVPSPPVQLRSNVEVVAVGGEAFVVGQSEEPNACGVLHILAYDLATNAWRELPAGPVAPQSDMVTVWTGSELFFGGGAICENGIAVGDPRTNADLLDPVTGEWRKAAPAPTGFYGSYRYPDTWTGRSVAALTQDSSIILYNPSTDSWHVSPRIDETQAALAPNNTPVVAIDNTLVIASGGLVTAGGLCCDAIIGTYAYTIPDGF